MFKWGAAVVAVSFLVKRTVAVSHPEPAKAQPLLTPCLSESEVDHEEIYRSGSIFLGGAEDKLAFLLLLDRGFAEFRCFLGVLHLLYGVLVLEVAAVAPSLD